MCDCSFPKFKSNELSNFIACCEFQQLWPSTDNRWGGAGGNIGLISVTLTTAALSVLSREIKANLIGEKNFPFRFFPIFIHFKLKGQENNVLEKRQVLSSNTHTQQHKLLETSFHWSFFSSHVVHMWIFINWCEYIFMLSFTKVSALI